MFCLIVLLLSILCFVGAGVFFVLAGVRAFLGVEIVGGLFSLCFRGLFGVTEKQVTLSRHREH
jgi:hypothetical protein